MAEHKHNLQLIPRLIDRSLYFLSIWLNVYTGLISQLLIGAAAGIAVYASGQGTLTSGAAGLILSLTVSISSSFSGVVRTFASLETAMNSVERIKFY